MIKGIDMDELEIMARKELERIFGSSNNVVAEYEIDTTVKVTVHENGDVVAEMDEDDVLYKFDRMQKRYELVQNVEDAISMLEQFDAIGECGGDCNEYR